jgi:hypothetical protein
MRRQVVPAVVLASVALLALTGAIQALAAPTLDPSNPSPDPTSASQRTSSSQQPSPRPDPPSDELGWEGGYWYDEAIDVDQSDGLTDAELERLTFRTMARVERLRGLEFRRDVEVEPVDREGLAAYVERNVTQVRGGDQFWEALFVVGESRDASDVIYRTLTNGVVGMAAEEGVDHVVLLTADPDRPRVDGDVLAHELVHVLQDQHFDLSAPRYRRSTLDGELAKDGVVEGEASYVDGLYRERCRNGTWDCVAAPGVGVAGERSRAVSTLVAFPYAEGGQYVGHLVETRGWDAVDARHRDLPVAFEQVIHEASDVDEPPPIEVADRSREGWRPTSERANTAGEAGVFLLFWAQAARGNADVMDPGTLREGGSMNVSHPLSAGWENDAFRPYGNDTAGGYVWVTEWESRRDARQFADGYRRLLTDLGARAPDERTGVLVLQNGSFADAFAVDRDGTRVTIVNGPDVAALADVRPGAVEEPSESEIDRPPAGTPTRATIDGERTGRETPASGTTEREPTPDATSTAPPTRTSVPVAGFGVASVAWALVAGVTVAGVAAVVGRVRP